MDEFKKYLEEEGLSTNDSDYKEFDIPILPIVDLNAKKLKYFKVERKERFQERNNDKHCS